MDEIKQSKPASAPSLGSASDIMGGLEKKFGGVNLFGSKGSKTPLEKSGSKPDSLKEVKKSGISMSAPEYDPQSLSEQGRKFLSNPEENFDEVELIHDVPGMIETYKTYGLDSNKFVNKMTDNKLARQAARDMFPNVFGELYKLKGDELENGRIPLDAENYAFRKAFKEIFNNPKKAQEFQEKMRFRAADEKAKLIEDLKKGSK